MRSNRATYFARCYGVASPATAKPASSAPRRGLAGYIVRWPAQIEALIRVLSQTTAATATPQPRIEVLKEILGMVRSEPEPAAPLPPPRHYCCWFRYRMSRVERDDSEGGFQPASMFFYTLRSALCWGERQVV